MPDLYLIDSNVVIEAARTYYPFERVPAFWIWLEEKCVGGMIRSIEIVGIEVTDPPALVDWMRARERQGLYLDTSDPGIQAEYQRMGDWIQNQTYGEEHVAEFFRGADLWIVATASVHSAIAVTQEVLAGPGTKKVKIPDICQSFGVPWMNTFSMLDELGASF